MQRIVYFSIIFLDFFLSPRVIFIERHLASATQLMPLITVFVTRRTRMKYQTHVVWYRYVCVRPCVIFFWRLFAFQAIDTSFSQRSCYGCGADRSSYVACNQLRRRSKRLEDEEEEQYDAKNTIILSLTCSKKKNCRRKKYLAYKSQKRQQMKIKKNCIYDEWSTGAIR